MRLTGIVGSDTVEGSCVYLETSDGTPYELLYAPGAGLLPPAIGSTVTLEGELMPDMASICQIGPIFMVTEVVATSDR